MAVIYFIDTDDISDGPNANENRMIDQEIMSFCNNNGFEFVWFHEVIEQVFVGRRVSKKEKKTVAERFSSEDAKRITRSKLCCVNYNGYRMGTSNIDMVLCKFFAEKTA